MTTSKTTRSEPKSILTASHWGIFYALVENDKIIGVKPYEGDQAPSPNLAKLARWPYSENRLLHPYVRESFLKHGPASRDRRGKDRFVQVSWDQAYQLIAKELDRIYREDGPEAVWGSSYGWRSSGLVHSAGTLLHRFLNLCGGYQLTLNNYSEAAIENMLRYCVGGMQRTSSWDDILTHSERVILWGADPIVTNDIDWTTTLHPYRPYLEQLRAKGTPVYAINPLNPETGKALNATWLPIIPGTDTALMLALIERNLSEDRVDFEFLRQYTTGSESFLAYVKGETDGIRKTPAWASQQCGLDEETIIRLADDIGTHRTIIMLGWGPQRAKYGEQPCWAAYALAAALGQIGLPGGGVGTSFHYASGGAPQHQGVQCGAMSRVKPVRPYKASDLPPSFLPVARWPDIFLNPGKQIEFNGKTVRYPHIKAVFWSGGNPFAHQPQLFRALKAWRRPEVSIVMDTVWSPTAKLADIVLPCATTLERNDLSPIGSETRMGLVAMKQAIAPQGESRSDYEALRGLAAVMGFEEAFTEGKSEMDWIQTFYEGARERQPTLPEFETFWEKGIHLVAKREDAHTFVSLRDFRQDPERFALKTETGKIVLTSETIASYQYDECKAHPVYFEPIEKPSSQYPLWLITPKSPERLHSQLDYCRELPEGSTRHEPCVLHPDDAQQRGIREGDIVKVFNARGQVLARAHLSHDVKAGVCVIRHGGWFTPLELSLIHISEPTRPY